MSIAGRRSLRTSDDDSFETYFNQISNFLDVNDIFEVSRKFNWYVFLNALIKSKTEDNQESNPCPSYSDTGACLAKAMVQSLAMNKEAGDVMVGVGRGVVEYLVTGDISGTWGLLRRHPYVITVVSCLHQHGKCET